MVRTVVAEFFAEQGLEVLEAENAEVALEILNERSDVALLFTDVNMPGRMDGLALSRQVHRRWPRIKLMLTSGRHVAASEMPIGAEFIPKPYDLEALATRMSRLLHG